MENYTLPTILTDNANVILDSIKREKERYLLNYA